MSVVKLNPIDGLPDWTGRKVAPEWQKKRATKRGRRFLLVEWGELTFALGSIGADQTIRLLLTLYLHRNLSKVRDGWIDPDQKDLTAVGIIRTKLWRTVARLEARGLIEVRRRPGKRPLLRLVPRS
jgi:hypothetical protein